MVIANFDKVFQMTSDTYLGPCQMSIIEPILSTVFQEIPIIDISQDP